MPHFHFWLSNANSVQSPWWLVRKERLEDAKKTLQSMVSAKGEEYDVDQHIAMMVHTNAIEKAVNSGTSYKDLFVGIDRRRTEITCGVWLVQVTCGTWFGGNVLYFLEQAGFNTRQSFNFNLAKNALALVGTFCAWWAMEYVGRRKLYVWGVGVMFAILMIVGCLGIPGPGEAIAYASGTLLMIFSFIFALTVGPVCYCLVTEIPSTRLRIKTVAVARNAYNVVSIGANYLNNPILNPTAWNLRGKGGFVWAPFALISFIWTYYRLPEPKGRTAGEIDVLFEQGVSARRWSRTTVDEFRTQDFATQEKLDQIESKG